MLTHFKTIVNSVSLFEVDFLISPGRRQGEHNVPIFCQYFLDGATGGDDCIM